MALDTPASIAILGAGPIGLEAALYARFLGYDVQLLERGRICEHLRRWGHERLFTPWHMIGSPLGIAALSAQNPEWRPPERDALLTGNQLIARYYEPLAQSDLVIDGLREHAEVVAVGRETFLAGEGLGSEAREDESFRILVRDAAGERVVTADAVIDATGTLGHPNWTGQGGIPAVGERVAAEQTERGIIDICGEQRAAFAGKRVLVIGAGHSAATNVVNLATLDPRPTVMWVTRRVPNGSLGPVSLIENDPFPERDQLARAANSLAKEPVGCVAHWPGTWVEALEWQPETVTFRVKLVGAYAATLDVDRVVANVGHRADYGLSRTLAVRAKDADKLVQKEPDYYVLGAKTRAAGSHFAIADGLTQIRDLFRIIGDREGLDLYANMRKLPT